MSEAALHPVSEHDPVVDLPQEEERIKVFDLDGYTVYVGLNAVGNERLISEHKERHPRCLWLHAMGGVGSHVVCCLGDKGQVPYEIFKKAGRLALEYSRSRGLSVRFAALEKLFKPEPEAPGVWWAASYRCLDI